MNVLITGSNGFIGKNLKANIRATRSEINILCFDVDASKEDLAKHCEVADFVFHLAGVNRPEKVESFYEGNTDLTRMLLETLASKDNRCPVLMTSSSQALLDNDYGKSKKAAEDEIFAYGKQLETQVYVYRLPGVFGKWCRPNYNSVVATFCHKIANGEPIEVNGRETELQLVYIDDVIKEFFAAMDGFATFDSDKKYCEIPAVYRTTLGIIADEIKSFRDSRSSLLVPDLSKPFQKKLYSTYLSYLPKNSFSYEVITHSDPRGSFTELLKTPDRGQFSVNVIKPGITKGQHWHNTKNEKFVVVSGKGAVCFRKIGTNEIIKYSVSDEDIEIIDVPVGYTHSIINTGETDMVAFIWCNEVFDPNNPDTFFEEV